MRYLKERSLSRILEVGSGPNGLGEFTSRPFVGCDESFPWTPLPHMMPIAGSALRLPFRDAAFDAVLSLDMLEHIPPQGRGRALAEVTRVSERIVVVGCPCGERARRADGCLRWWYGRREQTMPGWLDDHVRWPFPEAGDLLKLLHDLGLRVTVFGSENVGLHLLMMVGESVEPVNRQFLRLLGRRRLAPALLRLMNFGPSYRQIFFAEKRDQG